MYKKHTTRNRSWPVNAYRFLPSFEVLEDRRLLAADVQSTDDQPAVGWFARWDQDVREEAAIAAGKSATEWYSQFVGPRRYQITDWVVRLSEAATGQLPSIDSVTELWNQGDAQFTLVAGLGAPGMLHVRSLATDTAQAEHVLRTAPSVVSFSMDQTITAQDNQRLPNDTFFGKMTNLDSSTGQFNAKVDADIDAPEAWNTTVGSPSVVVGLIDSGVDLAHRDLYENIWINQGEIPSAIKSRLIDVPSKLDASKDGLITFYDLNDPVNRAQTDLLVDYNNNGYIDALDLLRDPLWSDGRDTDGNQFIDDFFGWNFLSGSSDSYAANNPSDSSGHGTHVAGIIGASGNNSFGTVGVNWQTSIMSLRFLGDDNRGDLSSAISAINYATMMRKQFGINVRVLNNSWGQTGGANPLLQQAIQESGDAGILFVAAAGNGNVLGVGVDNDRTPFYPAGYDTNNIIAVAASDSRDSLASFSNFGTTNVDIAAPGIGVFSTLPGNQFGALNGTSMATPHVSGVAALIWNQQKEASVAEVRKAILESADTVIGLQNKVSSGKRVNANLALKADIFAPVATIISVPDVTQSGGTSTTIKVQFETTNSTSIDVATIGDRDIVVRPLSVSLDDIPGIYVPGSVSIGNNGKRITADYTIAAPGGQWDILDTGLYQVIASASGVKSSNGLGMSRKDLGRFAVRLEASTGLFYATTFADTLDVNPGDGVCRDANNQCSLRAAVQESNARPNQPVVLVLAEGNYALGIAPVWTAVDDFPLPSADILEQIGLNPTSFQWSNERSGDLDVRGKLTILGSGRELTTIDGKSIDRLFKVYPSGNLELRRATLTNGNASQGKVGGGILSAGKVSLIGSSIVNSTAQQGSAVATWTGGLDLNAANIMNNSQDGAVFIAQGVTVNITQSSLVRNWGGAVRAINAGPTLIENTTISENQEYTVRNDVSRRYGSTERPSISADGRYVAIGTKAQLNLYDSNDTSDIYLYDRVNDSFQLISKEPGFNDPGAFRSTSPVISADGNRIAFLSLANLDGKRTTGWTEVYLFDRRTNSVISLTDESVNDQPKVILNKFSLAISADGSKIAFVAQRFDGPASIYVKDISSGRTDYVGIAGEYRNLPYLLEFSDNGRFLAYASGENGSGKEQIAVFDTTGQLPIRWASVTATSVFSNQSSMFNGINNDGNEVLFETTATNLVPQAANGTKNVYLKNLETGKLTLVSKPFAGQQPNGSSKFGQFLGASKIGFVSQATNLNNNPDLPDGDRLFSMDRQTQSIVRLSTTTLQSLPTNTGMVASSDGNLIAYAVATNSTIRGSYSVQLGGFYLFDSLKNTQSYPMGGAYTQFQISNATLKANPGREAAPYGPTGLFNSIVISDFGVFGFSTDVEKPIQVRGQNIINALQLIDVLSKGENGTWYHSIPRESDAWNSAGTTLPSSVDQLGNPRGGSGIGLGFYSEIGAVETVQGSLHGFLHRDFDKQRGQSSGEYGLAGIQIVVDLNRNESFDEGEPFTVTEWDDPSTPSINETGAFEFTRVPAGNYHLFALLDDNWKRSTYIVSPTVKSRQGGSRPAISSNGRFVAFQANSENLLPNGADSLTNVFVLDRQTEGVERLAKTSGDARLPSISGDGRYVVYESGTNIFLYDRATKSGNVVSNKADGTPGNGVSRLPSIDAAGTTVVFSSKSTNLSDLDTGGFFQIYSYDIKTGKLSFVSVNNLGLPANADCFDATVSNSGSKIAYATFARNLSGGSDQDQFLDVYLWDSASRSVSWISNVPPLNIGVFENLSAPSISGDGNGVVFQTTDGISKDNVQRGFKSWFYSVAERQLTELVSLSLLPQLSELGRVYSTIVGNSIGVGSVESGDFTPLIQVGNSSKNQRGNVNSLSRDGSAIAFDTNITLLIPQDRNTNIDVYITDVPSRVKGLPIVVHAGETYDIDLPYSPIKRSMSGSVFLDSDVSQFRSEGEPGQSNWTVYLDLNRNGSFDSSEPSKQTDFDGRFTFTELESVLEYWVSVVAQTGYQSTSEDGPTKKVFLNANASLFDIDFGFLPLDTSGQSNDAKVSGVVFDDLNGNGLQDVGEKGVPFVDVALERDNGSVFQQTRTDSNGVYLFSQQGTVRLNVRTINGEPTKRLGNRFTSQAYNLATGNAKTPQSIIAADFNNDGNMDFASAMFTSNEVAIKFNDGKGGFGGETLFIDLATAGGTSPTAIATGLLNNNAFADLVTANRGNNSISILMDAGTTNRVQVVKLLDGQPIDVAIGDFTGDNLSDILVLIEETSKMQLFIGNSDRLTFRDPIAFAIDLNQPKAFVTDDFNKDGIQDVAVVNFGNSTLSIYHGSAQGTLVVSDRETLVGKPSEITSADFDGDGNKDLAVIFADTNMVSLFVGNGNGGFQPIATQFPTGSTPNQVLAADIDSDGDSDVLLTYFVGLDSNNSWAVLRNKGTLGKADFEPVLVDGVLGVRAGNRQVMAVADFDKTGESSGMQDFVMVNSRSNQLRVFRNERSAARRVQLDGIREVPNISFGIQLPPKINDIVSPSPVFEDSGEQVIQLSGIAQGRELPVDLPMKVMVFSSRPDVIPIPPSVEFDRRLGTATLRYTPSRDRSGTVVMSVEVVDAGTDKILNNADDQKVIKSFTVVLVPVNDPPSMDINPALLVNIKEDSGPQSISGFATNISAGGGVDEQSQSVSFNLGVDQEQLFAVRPVLSPTGVLTFTTAPNASGIATVTLTATDTGGTANSGNDKVIKNFVLNVLPVNDPPTIIIGGKQTISTGAAAQSISNFGSGFTTGGGLYEMVQELDSYLLSVDKQDLFLVQPAIDKLGTLTYTPSASLSGTAKISVRVRDNGGSLNGGIDLSTAQSFDIQVTPATVSSDFGDAPTAAQSGFLASYPTRLANNGASHIRTTLVLGSVIDAESDGQPSLLATGDDTKDNAGNSDDEDGIVFPFTNLIGSTTVSTSSYIAIVSGIGFIDAWIDFNRDGDWNDSGEQISNRVPVTVGRNHLTFTIPTGAIAGTTYGRFRLSSAGGHTPTGSALDGEVEDYSVELTGGSSSTPRILAEEFGAHQISVVSGAIRVERNAQLFWSTPANGVSTFSLINNSGTTLLSIGSPGSDMPGRIVYTDLSTPNVLRVEVPLLDFKTFAPSRLSGIQSIDLTSAGKNEFAFTSSDLQTINPQKQLRIVMNADDRLIPNRGWKAREGRSISGQWQQSYTNGDATVEVLSARPWRNELFPEDINGDGNLAPLDVLFLINRINTQTTSTLPPRSNEQSTNFFDPNGDGSSVALDVLQVINLINSNPGQGEGELVEESVDYVIASYLAEILDENAVGRKRTRMFGGSTR